MNGHHVCAVELELKIECHVDFQSKLCHDLRENSKREKGREGFKPMQIILSASILLMQSEVFHLLLCALLGNQNKGA